MESEVRAKISRLKLGEILIKIHNGENLAPVFETLSAYQMKDLRNFLEEEVMYLSSLRDEVSIKLSEVKSNYEPVPNYYYRQNCREALEACLNETCLDANPECFSNKMKSQIDVLIKLMTPYMEKQ